VHDEPLVRLDYAAAVRAGDLVACEVIDDPASVRLLIAAEVGPVRLIDNCAGATVAPAGVAAVAHGGRARRLGHRLEKVG